jgi:hypothetical protein
MSSLNHLFRFEANIEKALAAAIQAIGYPVTVQALSDTQVQTPYCQVDASSFAQASGQMAFAGTEPFYNHFQGLFSVSLVTTRDPGGVSEALQKKWRGDIAALLSKPRQGLKVPGYDIFAVTPTGSSFSQDQQLQQDRTELTFSIELAIPGGAVQLERN